MERNNSKESPSLELLYPDKPRILHHNIQWAKKENGVEEKTVDKKINSCRLARQAALKKETVHKKKYYSIHLTFFLLLCTIIQLCVEFSIIFAKTVN